ncbi:hypothetical protein Tco_0589533, partial [Tanacetum coccineum]
MTRGSLALASYLHVSQPKWAASTEGVIRTTAGATGQRWSKTVNGGKPSWTTTGPPVNSGCSPVNGGRSSGR